MSVYTAHCSRAWTIQGTLAVHCTQGWLDADFWWWVTWWGVCPLCTVFTCPLSLPCWPGPQPRPGSGAAWAGADLRLRQTRFSLQCIIQLTRGLGPGTASLAGEWGWWQDHHGEEDCEAPGYWSSLQRCWWWIRHDLSPRECRECAAHWVREWVLWCPLQHVYHALDYWWTPPARHRPPQPGCITCRACQCLMFST